MLDPLILLALMAVGMLAGFVDAIAGGGGMITVPALLAAGLPPVAALGTNKMQSIVGTGMAVFTYWRRGFVDLRRLIPAIALTFAGSFLGAMTVSKLDTSLLTIAVPVALIAIAVYFLFAPMGLANSFAGLVLAHVVLATPFVVLAVMAALQGFDFGLLRAGASLGAPPHTVVLRVLVPLIAPGVGAGMIFAFMTSFDEAIAALFLAGPEQRTLPIQMFEGLREQVSPTIAAAATLLVIASCLLLASAELFRRAAERRNSRLSG